MDSRELIKAGKLSDARKQLVEEVKSSPADMGRRTMLFQAHSLLGEWDRAERQLDVIAAQDPDRDTGVQVYKNLLSAEKERLEAYNNDRRPSFMPEPPPYLEMYYAARNKLVENRIEEAKELFDKIDAQIPDISGTVNGKNFAGFRDTDIFVSLFLEAIVHERYILIPFEKIRELSISRPKTFSDLIWISANITTWEGLTLNCFLPVLYFDSFKHGDDRVKLGRMTDWTPLGGPFSRGVGQRVFHVGEEDVPILEIREVIFKAPESIKDV
ncbi:MAG TPA: hypothetical protein ENH01_09030 [Nitrospirae bacterium]|nr:hypothetical protein [Nitrospirota bacterium]